MGGGWRFGEGSTNMELALVSLTHSHSQSGKDSFVHSCSRLFTVYSAYICFVLLH